MHRWNSSFLPLVTYSVVETRALTSWSVLRWNWMPLPLLFPWLSMNERQASVFRRVVMKAYLSCRPWNYNGAEKDSFCSRLHGAGQSIRRVCSLCLFVRPWRRTGLWSYISKFWKLLCLITWIVCETHCNWEDEKLCKDVHVFVSSLKVQLLPTETSGSSWSSFLRQRTAIPWFPMRTDDGHVSPLNALRITVEISGCWTRINLILHLFVLSL